MKSKTDSKNIFAPGSFFGYSHNASAKSGVGINNPFFANRQSESFVYGGLLEAAHVAGRFYLRGVVNLEWFATNIRLTTDGGAKKTKQIGIAMTIFNRIFVFFRIENLFFNEALLYA